MPEKLETEERFFISNELSVCPFLGIENQRFYCLATRGPRYQEIISVDVPKCESIWKNCPLYQRDIIFYREWKARRIPQ